jgi:hypothetical protein
MVDALGFSGTGGRAACQWIAVEHGRSTAGNAHIHLAVPSIREDGSRADAFRDQVKASAVCAAMEARFGLTVAEGRAGGGLPALSWAELDRAARTGAEPERRYLARIVRGVAAVSVDEEEFVRCLRRDVQVRLRVATSGQTIGYAVALSERAAGRVPLWFSGSKLAADLTWPKIYRRWRTSPAGGSGSGGSCRAGDPGRDGLDTGRRRTSHRGGLAGCCPNRGSGNVDRRSRTGSRSPGSVVHPDRG